MFVAGNILGLGLLGGGIYGLCKPKAQEPKKGASVEGIERDFATIYAPGAKEVALTPSAIEWLKKEAVTFCTPLDSAAPSLRYINEILDCTSPEVQSDVAGYFREWKGSAESIEESQRN